LRVECSWRSVLKMTDEQMLRSESSPMRRAVSLYGIMLDAEMWGRSADSKHLVGGEARSGMFIWFIWRARGEDQIMEIRGGSLAV